MESVTFTFALTFNMSDSDKEGDGFATGPRLAGAIRNAKGRAADRLIAQGGRRKNRRHEALR
jgi:hypothetical protein